MANAQIGNPIGNGSVMSAESDPSSESSAIDALFFNATKDISSARAALKNSDNGAYYTDARLDAMTWNDLMYCLANETLNAEEEPTP